ncbi:hypothetical protein AX17_002045 [Amanita inopinata Kibby_2008]|nr:hypothetical protein AX17_002045 [Amanita inopinata Kibby_2008]
MAHKPTSSIDSTDSVSSLTSIEWVKSYHLTSEMRNTMNVMESKYPFKSLENTAKKLIDNLAASKEQDEYEQQLRLGSIKLELHKVLKAMLEQAEPCGGMNAKRYVAAAICACMVSDNPVSAETLNVLCDLGKTWFTHFLFIFYGNQSHLTQSNHTPSSYATPTCDETGSVLDQCDKPRQAHFRDQLLIRDGFRCVATKIPDANRPQFKGDIEAGVARLEGCHILKSGVALFNSKKDTDAYDSPVTTFDILRNFANMPEEMLEKLDQVIDDPSNGISLTSLSHRGFARFCWCLHQGDAEHQYKVKIYGAEHGLGDGSSRPRTIEFKNYSNEFQTTGSQRKTPEIPLPNPLFIKIHAAVAGILHMSGATGFLDKIYDDYDRPGRVPSGGRSWDQLQWEILAIQFTGMFIL